MSSRGIEALSRRCEPSRAARFLPRRREPPNCPAATTMPLLLSCFPCFPPTSGPFSILPCLVRFPRCLAAIFPFVASLNLPVLFRLLSCTQGVQGTIVHPECTVRFVHTGGARNNRAPQVHGKIVHTGGARDDRAPGLHGKIVHTGGARWDLAPRVQECRSFCTPGCTAYS